MTKDARAYNGVKTVSSIYDVRNMGLAHEKEMKLDHQLTPYAQIKSRLIKDLSWDTIKILVENIDSKISYISHSNIFAVTSLRAREIKEKYK